MILRKWLPAKQALITKQILLVSNKGNVGGGGVGEGSTALIAKQILHVSTKGNE